ncbi:hypothetical protein GRZ55_05385 [Chelativorans sp. ZYF759]|uniref:hypothetical protein n=1 Tax=Chelativorans sp. ZYF759 TaxID=2692213 RepID=UPI00145E0172|nr:hypothetical protein [Chelativorans sp. ZYF759]NMG38674.1 hypothetical protein [Chelativorans sp. ZYF759]
MARRTDNLYGNYNAASSAKPRASGLMRASVEWIAVALVMAAGAAIVLFWFA